MLSRSPIDKILIVGGYGSVGGKVAKLLAPRFGDRLMIGGRSQHKAYKFAHSLGVDAGHRTIDVEEPASFSTALIDVCLVLVCVDTSTLLFPQACILQGIDYVDITASVEVIERLKSLEGTAREHAVTVVSSVGLAPGLSSLLAKACVTNASDPVSSISIHILLGVGEHHGKGAVEWMVNRLHRPYSVDSRSGRVHKRPFVDSSTIEFPNPLGQRITYQIDFSDQHTLPETLNVPVVSTWCTFDLQWIATLLSWAARTGLLRLAAYLPVHRLFVRCFDTPVFGTDRYSLVVVASAENSRVLTRCSATGNGEAHATALIAAATIRCLLATPRPRGVISLENLLDLNEIEKTLHEHDIKISTYPMITDGGSDQPDESVRGIVRSRPAKSLVPQTHQANKRRV